MEFIKRNTAPGAEDPHWLSIKFGGLNECILIKDKSCLPNCVGYSWGRFMEVLNSRPNLSRRNAENWYGFTNDNYERGMVPRVGAIACWRKGQVENESDGAGHVAHVEAVNADGSIYTSNSGAGGTRFWMQTVKPPYNIGSAYTFQGFIYSPIIFDGATAVETKPSIEDIANDVIEGKYGNGNARKAKLTKEGYDYYLVQAKVKELLVKPVAVTPIVASPVSTSLKMGDTVTILSRGNANCDGNGLSAGGIGWTRVVLNNPSDFSGKPNPIRVGNSNGTTGWYKESALKKVN